MFALSVQSGIDKCGLPVRPTPCNRQILLLQTTPLHQEPKSARDVKSLGNQDQTAGLTIEAVYNGDLAPRGDFEREEFPQLLPQSSRAVRFRRVNQ